MTVLAFRALQAKIVGYPLDERVMFQFVVVAKVLQSQKFWYTQHWECRFTRRKWWLETSYWSSGFWDYRNSIIVL